MGLRGAGPQHATGAHFFSFHSVTQTACHLDARWTMKQQGNERREKLNADTGRNHIFVPWRTGIELSRPVKQHSTSLSSAQWLQNTDGLGIVQVIYWSQRHYLELVGLFDDHLQLGVLAQDGAAHLGHVLRPHRRLVVIGVSCRHTGSVHPLALPTLKKDMLAVKATVCQP